MRLDRYLSAAGECSRRECAREVRAGVITIDGVPVRSSDASVTPGVSLVERRGRTIEWREHVYIMLNKPEGYVSATEDKRDGCPVVTELCPDRDRARVFPCGRLDKYTVGLMLLTDDGEMAHRLLAPSRHVDKSYGFVARDPLDGRQIEMLQNGVYIEGCVLTAPCLVDMHGETCGTITIHEGKYHQIKQMFGAVGNRIDALERISFGPLRLDPTLERGECRYLTDHEVALLRSAAGMQKAPRSNRSNDLDVKFETNI